MLSLKNIYTFIIIGTTTLSASAKSHEAEPTDTEHNIVTIIGSGPAGLTAGMYAARENMNPAVFHGPVPDGQLGTVPTITNWPGDLKISGTDLIKKLTEQAQEAGARFIDSTIKRVECTAQPIRLTTTDHKVYTTDTLIIATGSEPRTLNVEGEEEYWGKGVSVCALCDGTFFKDKPIVIVGDSYLALKNACAMKNQTNDITMIIPGKKLKGPRLLRKQVKAAKVKIIKNSQVTAIRGDGEKVTGVEITQKRSKRSDPTIVQVTQVIPTDAVFVSIGFKPSTDIVCGEITLDKSGKICTTRKCETNIPGIYAAGACTDAPNPQAVVCAAAGCVCACEIDKYLDAQSISKSNR